MTAKAKTLNVTRTSVSRGNRKKPGSVIQNGRDSSGRFTKDYAGKQDGCKNLTTRAGRHNIFAALEFASRELKFKKTFDPLNKLLELIEDEDFPKPDKAHICLQICNFIFPKKRSVDLQLSPGVMPQIAINVTPDEEGIEGAQGLLPPGTSIVPGQPIVINIGGSSEKKESEDEILL